LRDRVDRRVGSTTAREASARLERVEVVARDFRAAKRTAREAAELGGGRFGLLGAVYDVVGHILFRRSSGRPVRRSRWARRTRSGFVIGVEE
jgi:hypothetical protein